MHVSPPHDSVTGAVFCSSLEKNTVLDIKIINKVSKIIQHHLLNG